MIKIGIVGTSAGNGHPYSYSAIFNGYNEKNLYQNCPFYLIKDYLPKYHKNINSIKGAIVSHIWTQNKNESKRIAGVSNIPNISNSLDDLIKNVDAIILARDDPQNHFNILKKIAKSKKTFFVDKQIVHSQKNFDKFKKTPQILENVLVKDKSIINNSEVKKLIKKAEKLMNGHGRILVRASGTESKIRVMGESENRKLLEKCLNIILTKLK